jgi:NAD(P)-dependent dehydrogenase (short-subunit alcohol dehydrogenase family)
MRTVLVAGAAGGIGESIVRSLLASGEAKVFATSRKAERLDELRGRLEPELRAGLTAIVGDAGDFAGAATIAERAAALGGIDAAVAILGRGSWSSGPLLELSSRDWTTVLDEMLTGHFAFARAVIPILATRADGLYLSIGGGAAFEPVPDAGLVSIAGAAQAMLTRVLAREIGTGPPRIRELVINGPVSTRESRPSAGERWITGAEAGAVVEELIRHGTTTWTPMRSSGPLLVMDARP